MAEELSQNAEAFWLLLVIFDHLLELIGCHVLWDDLSLRVLFGLHLSLEPSLDLKCSGLLRHQLEDGLNFHLGLFELVNSFEAMSLRLWLSEVDCTAQNLMCDDVVSRVVATEIRDSESNCRSRVCSLEWLTNTDAMSTGEPPVEELDLLVVLGYPGILEDVKGFVSVHLTL